MRYVKLLPIIGLLLLAVMLCGCTTQKAGVTNHDGVDVLKDDSTAVAAALVMQHASVDNGSLRFGLAHAEYGYNSVAINMGMTFTTNGTEHHAQVIYEPRNLRIDFASIDGVAV